MGDSTRPRAATLWLYENVDEGVDDVRMVNNIWYFVITVIFVVLRIWFAANIRDWRDRFHTKKLIKQEKVKKKAEDEERMAAMGLQMVNFQQNGM